MNIEKKLKTALGQHQSGRLKEAEALYREIIAHQPDQPDALHLLGVVAYQMNDPDTAIQLISKAATINGSSPEYHCNLGNAFRLKGEHLKAAECYRETIRLNPLYAEAYNNLGSALRNAGLHREALDAYHKAIEIKPDYASACYNLGNLSREMGELEKAVEYYRNADEHQPARADTLKNLGETLGELGRTDEAIACLKAAAGLKPGDMDMLFSLAALFNKQGEHAKGIELYQKVIEVDPTNTNGWNNLGTSLIDSGRAEEGISVLRRAAERYPRVPELQYNLGRGLETLGRLGEALRSYQRAIELNPDLSTAWNNLGGIYKNLGDCENALSSYRTALEKYPADTMRPEISQAGIHSNIPFTMHYAESIDPDELFEQHRRWAHDHASALEEYIPEHGNEQSLGRRLKVGYVSPDFRVHSVAYFIQSILAAHDRKSFEVFCYSNVKRADGATELLKRLADHWRDIYTLPDEVVSEMIQADGIDILVDLSGHTANNRMTLFARKPAPVQVTYLGYPDTTGLETIGYRITDACADPPGTTDKWNSETLVRMKDCFLCYAPPEGTPDITGLPAERSGRITFGCFNNRAKITKKAIETWSSILAAIPGSRLILKAKTMEDPLVKEGLEHLFHAHGVAPDRITIMGFTTSKKDHFELYNTVDIALDTFPYNGTTTTCEALWMGVPVLTLEGNTHASRVGVSILTATGLTRLIAGSREEYIQKAVTLAKDLAQLKSLRSSLRASMIGSPLMDAKTFTHNLEHAYRMMWHAWCGTYNDKREEGAMNEYPDRSSVNPGQQSAQPAGEAATLLQEGEEHFHAGRLEDAVGSFTRVLRIDSGNVDALNNLGVISWQAGEMDKAIERFEQALKIDPDNVDADHNLRMIRESQQDSHGHKPSDKAESDVPSEEDCLRVNVSGELQVCVPPSIELMTPYILLEQEDWFEEEIHFIRKILKHGMHVIDIGANYGLYTLTMARMVGPEGRVWAFEPTSRTAAYLRKSIGENGLANVTLVQAGLSDKNGTAKISLNSNPELNEVTAEPVSGGEYETIELLNLDSCEKIYGWERIDFVKLDAEGQERNILLGGEHFLSSRSPLIMFELKHGSSINTELMGDFLERDYHLYRLVPGLGILAPFDAEAPIDPYQLNLFCCKKDRAHILEENGLLVTGLSSPESPKDLSLWEKGLGKKPFFSTLMASLAAKGGDGDVPIHGREHYEKALSLYVMAHEAGRTSDSRYASLSGAYEEIHNALEKGVTLPRLLTQARIMSELGKRGEALKTVESILHLVQSEKAVPVTEPFLPVTPRFDAIIPRDVSTWLVASVLEYGEKAKAYSSFYTGSSSLNNLEVIRQLGYQSPEMERRRQLIRMRFGLQSEPVPDPVFTGASPDNLNPEFWNAEKISLNMTRSMATPFEIKLKDKIHILDIGAMDIAGSENPYERLLAADAACVTGFEPLEEECAKLNGTDAKNRRFLPYALGDGTKRPFYITNTGMTSSLYEPNHDLTAKFENLDGLMQVIRVEEIQTVRLDDVADLGDVDFLKIDVQGAEKMIFENATRVLKDTLVIQVEVEFVPLYKNQPLFSDIDITLRQHGFEFHKFLGSAARLFKPFGEKKDRTMRMNQLLWAEAIYVKSFMELDRISNEKLLKYAMIMYEVYQSIDLSHLILVEYDRRTGSGLAQRYLQLIDEGGM